MKVLIVNTMYPPEVVGGAELSVSFLAEALVQRGHEVAVVCLHPEDDKKVEVRAGVRIYRLPVDNIYWPFEIRRKPSVLHRFAWHVRDTWNRKAARRFGSILDDEKPDVVHTNNLSGFSVSIWREIHRRNIRVVHTLRDYSLICKRGTLFANGKICEKRCFSCALFTAPYKQSSHKVDAVASNSKCVQDLHLNLDYFSGVPTKVIYNIAKFSEIAPVEHPPSEDMVFGFIGRVEPEKGIEVVLKATQLLPKTGWRLKIAGNGVPDYVASLKTKNPSERIEWLGFMPSSEFYSSVDVCLISSIWHEPLPRTLIECIASGKATICARAGGIPEIADLSALVGNYDPQDYRELAALMLKAMNEAAHWRQVHPIPGDFTMQFSADAIVDGYLSLFEGDAGRPRSRTSSL